ncbi:MAG TPA: metallophosphoesterase [Xanthobacteraceae bacterium]|jgi:diadenosine tetraphosphatase ApaH/serine/threonine PP2A family protein phosphatase|nr:metallophosphoesterase [Xanthobacteraceae bacterium]
MRIALFADIHGNREAFTACLDHASRSRIDRHVFLGDYVGYGADPVFAIETVMAYVERGAVALLGNHDAAALEPDPGMNDAAFAAMEWTRNQLGPAHLAFIKGLRLSCEEGSRLYVHANAYAPAAWDYVTGLYAASKCLTATQAQATFCGHTHIPMLFHMSMTGKVASFEPVDRVDIPLTTRRRWLAVIGSVGQPRDHNPAACYAIFDATRGILTYIRVPYDVDAAARKIRDAGLPVALSYRLVEGY